MKQIMLLLGSVIHWRVMKVEAEKEQLYYEEYDPVALKKITETQHKVIDFQKKNKQKDLFSIL